MYGLVPPVWCQLQNDEGALYNLRQVTDKDVKQDKFQYSPLQCWFVTGHQVEYNPLTTNLWAQLSNQFFYLCVFPLIQALMS